MRTRVLRTFDELRAVFNLVEAFGSNQHQLKYIVPRGVQRRGTQLND